MAYISRCAILLLSAHTLLERDVRSPFYDTLSLLALPKPYLNRRRNPRILDTPALPPSFSPMCGYLFELNSNPVYGIFFRFRFDNTPSVPGPLPPSPYPHLLLSLYSIL